MHIDTFAEIEEKAIVLDSDNDNYNPQGHQYVAALGICFSPKMKRDFVDRELHTYEYIEYIQQHLINYTYSSVLLPTALSLKRVY